jgi:hypothetical protein
MGARPLELLRHADEHLSVGGDTDRRIALIGFDQTIETSIEVYVRLHPRLRGGKEIAREEVNQALRSFHSKLEFLEKHLEKDRRTLGVSIEAIVWFHSLRNELYHSGNGMVPELHVLQGAREAAVRVFATVFGDDCAAEFVSDSTEQPPDPDAAVGSNGDSAMLFLSRYIEFEKLLRARVRGSDQREPVIALWAKLSQANPDLQRSGDELRFVLNMRNAIVHGATGDGPLPEEDISRAARSLWGLADMMRGSEGRCGTVATDR